MSYVSNVTQSNEAWLNNEKTFIVLGQFQDEPVSVQADAISAQLNAALKLGDFKGKTGENRTFYLGGKTIVVTGLGKKDKFDADAARKAAGQACRIAISRKVNNIAIECFGGEEYSQAIGEGVTLGSYQFLDYKTKKKDTFELSSVTVLGGEKDDIQKGATIGSSVCFSRDLGNHPGNTSTPTHLANVAQSIAKEGNMSSTVFEREEFTEMGMGGLAGVAQGTDEPPKFIILEYYGAEDKDEKPKVLVGKGLTFDAGGISIKPGASMDEMKYDMCGSATVLGVMHAIASLKPKINVVMIVPSTENLLGAKAYKPGDILTAYNGKTIEVLNTDAEGRLILADGLSYASKHYDPEFILDFATLTGAILFALGHEATGVMGTNNALMDQVKASSKNTGEKVWGFPLWPEYCKQIKSDIADVKNMGAPRQAGSIAAGAFLKEFVGKDIPWIHFDIAGTAWGGKPTSIDPKGSATGWGVRLVLDLLNV
jgi:leucyl aminopeptidase